MREVCLNEDKTSSGSFGRALEVTCTEAALRNIDVEVDAVVGFGVGPTAETGDFVVVVVGDAVGLMGSDVVGGANGPSPSRKGVGMRGAFIAGPVGFDIG